jgi:hypothetical protein
MGNGSSLIMMVLLSFIQSRAIEPKMLAVTSLKSNYAFFKSYYTRLSTLLFNKKYHQNMRVIDACYKSIASKQAVTLV